MSDDRKMYVSDYPNWLTMVWHDGYDELRRWIDNYKIERYGGHVAEYEWITIDKKGAYWVGEIGADHTEKRRTIRFEGTAPPPPTFFLPAKTKYVPPPPEPPYERMRREREYWDHMRRMEMIFAYERRNPPPPPPPPRYRHN